MLYQLIRDTGFEAEEDEPNPPVMNEEGTVSDKDDGDEEAKDAQHILEVRKREEEYPERMKTRQS